jgi:hypothetical protein
MGIPIQFTTHRLDPAEADIRIDGVPGVTGRVTGPRCRYASTVEVAYYIKSLPGGGARVIVPEPSFWDPQSPFLYEAVLQTQDGTKTTRRLGLRSVQLAAAGWRVNRKPFRVQGAFRGDLADAADLRAKGVNTIVCHVAANTMTVWDQADALGFFVLGLLPNEPAAIALSSELKDHPSCLGWVLDDANPDQAESLQTNLGNQALIGWRTASPTTAPPCVRFLVGPASLRESLVPWLFLSEDGPDDKTSPFGTVAARL